MYENDPSIYFDPSKQIPDAKFFIHFTMNEREQCSMMNKWFEFMKEEFILGEHVDKDKHKFIFEKARNIQTVILFMLQFMQEKLSYECQERGIVIKNIKESFF